MPVPGPHRRNIVRSSLVAALVLASLAPRAARADDVDAARRDFAEGVRLYQRGDYEGARRLFKKADSEHHAASIVYNLAVAEERLRRPQAAIDAYEAYIAEVGESGEFSGAAVVAIAQIKALSTRLRIDTKPSGVRLFVDGFPLSDPSPTTLLVSGGHHVVVAQGDGWRAEADVEAQGGGDTLAVSLRPPEGAASSAPSPVVPRCDRPHRRSVDPAAQPPTPALPDGLVWGAAFALAPYHLLGAAKGTSNDQSTTQVVAGAILEIGHAVTERFEFLGRGFVGSGPTGTPRTRSWAGRACRSVSARRSGWARPFSAASSRRNRGRSATEPTSSSARWPRRPSP